MKVALSIWNGRISPVFDVSERCLIIDDGSSASNGEIVDFAGWTSDEKARFLAEKGVSTLICGAVSHEYEESFLARGIELIPFIAGPIERVAEAWRAGSLLRGSFSMPGCGCPRRRRCGIGGRGGPPMQRIQGGMKR
jgi:predicted Fe-Mo cluster-binding NifX family protein